ncbi:MAG: AI-2E family transporter [Clostridia bacterium]|nr:AI-2E family transporter [Clostridia bacterium]
MFREKYRTYINWGITVVAIIFAGISFYFLFLRWSGIVSSFRTLSGILAPVSYGMIIAFILDSLVMTITRLLAKIPRGGRPLTRRRQSAYRAIGIMVSEIVFVAVIGVLIRSIVPQVADSLRTLITNFDRYIQNLEAWAHKRVEEYPVLEPYLANVEEQLSGFEESVKAFLKNDLLTTLTRVTSVVRNGLVEVGSYLYNFIIGVIVSIYLLFSKRRLLGLSKKLLFSLARPAQANTVLREARFTIRMFKSFLVGKLLDSIIVGVLCFLGTMIMKIPYSLLISIIVGVTNVIPYFGPFIGAVPSALLVLLLDPIKCLMFVIFIIILQQLDGNVIGVKILGGTTGVSSLGVMLSILIGGGLFGIMGMILCVPAYAVIYSLIKRAAEARLRKGGLPTDTYLYTTLDEIDPDTLAPRLMKSAPPTEEPAPEKTSEKKPGKRFAKKDK